jgi:hypothetical protein
MEIASRGFAAVRAEVAAARAADAARRLDAAATRVETAAQRAGEDAPTRDAGSASRTEETVTAFLSPVGSTPWGDATRP